MARTWRDDERFCDYLLHMNYAENTTKGVVAKLSTGLVTYIWEAWQASAGAKVQGWQHGD